MPPTRQVVLAKLTAWAEGTLAPEEASDWASPCVAQRDDEVEDLLVLEGLQALNRADAFGWERPLLFGKPHFESWLAEYREKLNSATSEAGDP